MAKIYLPTNLLNSDCKVVYNDFIRVYTNSNYTNWTDVFFKSGYYLKSGQSVYPVTPDCDHLNTFTDNVLYRYDSANSFLMFFIIAIVLFYFPFKIFSRAFGRWLKV